MEVQLAIDFSRAEQLGLLRDAQLPAAGGVIPATLKGVLRAIDDFGRGRECWPSVATLAQTACLSERQCRRAIDALKNILGVLIVDRKKLPGCGRATGNHYRIVWSELALLTKKRKADSRARLCASVSGPDQSAIWADQSAIWADQSAMHGRCRRIALEAQKEPPPPNPQTKPAAAAVLETAHDSWAAAAAALRAAGVELVDRILGEARARGLTPAGVLGIAAEYAANRGRLKRAGAIAFRVRTGVWPAAGIVSAAAAADRRKTQHLVRVAESRQTAADVAAVLADRGEFARLDAAFGRQLDALEAGQFDALVAAAWPEPLGFGRELARKTIRRNPRAFAVRLKLLQMLERLARSPPARGGGATSTLNPEP